MRCRLEMALLKLRELGTGPSNWTLTVLITQQSCEFISKDDDKTFANDS